MKKSEKKEDKQTPTFLKLVDACQLTGLPVHYLRAGCKDGSIPHIRSGTTYYVNIPRLLEQLNAN